jgi:hypothetical protein
METVLALRVRAHELLKLASLGIERIQPVIIATSQLTARVGLKEVILPYVLVPSG